MDSHYQPGTNWTRSDTSSLPLRSPMRRSIVCNMVQVVLPVNISVLNIDEHDRAASLPRPPTSQEGNACENIIQAGRISLFCGNAI
jgi:hypothetical protein